MVGDEVVGDVVGAVVGDEVVGIADGEWVKELTAARISPLRFSSSSAWLAIWLLSVSTIVDMA